MRMTEQEIQEYIESRMLEKLNERTMEHWDHIAGNKNLPVETRGFLSKIYHLGYTEAIIDFSIVMEDISKVNKMNGGN